MLYNNAEGKIFKKYIKESVSEEIAALEGS